MGNFELTRATRNSKLSVLARDENVVLALGNSEVFLTVEQTVQLVGMLTQGVAACEFARGSRLGMAAGVMPVSKGVKQ